ncbi:MAG: hypothetical protein ACJAWV_001920 [Flammeovirgaceae bacterium]|jgi:hypothetical protein
MKNKITIAEPCTESWEKMAQTGKADCAFCQSCQKEVIDFTQKSDKEIIRIMKGQKNVCGKFTQNQLDKTYQTSENFTVPYKWAMASLFSGLMLTQPAFSQNKKEKNPTIKTVSKFTSSESKSNIQPEIEGKDSTNTRMVSGIVRDDTGEVFPGALIEIKGTERGVFSGIDGRYSIEGIEQGAILVFGFVGYETKEVIIENQDTIAITLAPLIMGEMIIVSKKMIANESKIIVGGATSIHASSLLKKSIWHKIKRFPKWITSPFRKKHN